MTPGCASGFAESHGHYLTLLPSTRGFSAALSTEVDRDIGGGRTLADLKAVLNGINEKLKRIPPGARGEQK